MSAYHVCTTVVMIQLPLPKDDRGHQAGSQTYRKSVQLKSKVPCSLKRTEEGLIAVFGEDGEEPEICVRGELEGLTRQRGGQRMIEMTGQDARVAEDQGLTVLLNY